jgi:hypothetical protein
MDNEEKQKNYEIARKLIAEQNFTAAIVAGAIATLLAAAAYAITVSVLPIAHGFAVAGIGVVIGVSMGFLGRGIATKFAVAATLYTILGCFVGTVFRVLMALAPPSATSPLDALRDNSLSVIVERSISHIHLIDLVYWFIAVFAAVFLARRALSRSQRLAIALFEMRD